MHGARSTSTPSRACRGRHARTKGRNRPQRNGIEIHEGRIRDLVTLLQYAGETKERVRRAMQGEEKEGNGFVFSVFLSIDVDDGNVRELKIYM